MQGLAQKGRDVIRVLEAVTGGILRSGQFALVLLFTPCAGLAGF